MAKAKAPKAEQSPIPAALAKHLQTQEDAALTVSALLDAIIRALAPENGDVVEPAVYSLRHVHKLVDDLHLQLDSVCIARAAEVAS
jgi:hypothetical protein